jgi:hypothetical protein
MKYVKQLMTEIYTQLSTLDYEVSNDVILDTQNPFIIIGEPIAQQEGLKSQYYEKIIIPINCINMYEGSIQTIDMLSEVQDILENLDVTGLRIAKQQITNVGIITDNYTKIGTMTLEFKILGE